MRPTRFAIPVLAALTLLAQGNALAQSGAGASPKPTSGDDRLFLSFIEDAAVVEHQWWEIRGEMIQGDVIDANLVRGIVAFQPWKQVELGGTVGFGSTDTDRPFPDGSGATDLDVWGKYYLGHTSDKLELAAGGVLTVPTGDDDEGLGTDAFGLAGFAAVRYRLHEMILSGHIGVRFNEDAEILGGPEVDGETSPMLGVGVLYPHSDRIGLVAEADVEGERFDGGDTDFRVLGGVNWRPSNRGILRGAVSLGLTDGAPDVVLIGGWAWHF